MIEVTRMELKQEHEDGSATYETEMTQDMADLCIEYGFNLLLYCGILGRSPESLLAGLAKEITTMEELRDV